MQIVRSDNGFRDYLPIFATKEYLESNSGDYGWFLSERFVLPFYIDRKFIFKRMLITNETVLIDKNASVEDEKTFLNEVVAAVGKMGIHFIAQPPTNVVFRTYPDGVIHAPFGSYQIDLTLEEKSLFDNVHSKHRNVIRKAQRDGVIIKSGPEYSDECHRVLKATMSRQHMPYPSIEEFNQLKESLGGQIAFYVSLKDNVTQGVAAIPYNRHAAYYLYGGSIESPYGGSINLMHWQIMLDMKARGVQIYDFVGARINPPENSKFAGLQMFKERFGSTMKQGYLWKFSVHPVYTFLFNFIKSLVQIIRGKKSKGDVIDQERKRL